MFPFYIKDVCIFPFISLLHVPIYNLKKLNKKRGPMGHGIHHLALCEPIRKRCHFVLKLDKTDTNEYKAKLYIYSSEAR